MRPTSRGWWVLGLATTVLALGLWWRYPGLTGIGTALFGLLALDTAATALAGPLIARRDVSPTEVPRYGECSGHLSIVHSGRLAAATVEAVEPVGGELVDVPVGRLRPGGAFEATYQVPTARRGLLRVGPLRIHRYGPAGLTVHRAFAAGEARVRVLPRVLPVRAMPPGARRGHVGAEERVARGGTDLIGLHEYVPGDDLRRIHWATTARTGTLMVREDADPSQAHLAVVLDDRAASYGDPDAFEHAVEVAASLALAAYAEGHPVRLRSIEGGLDIELAGSVAGTVRPAHDLLAPLAEVSLVDSGVGPVVPAPPGELDVFAVVTGAAADTAPLALEASRAQAGAVLAVGDAGGSGPTRPVARRVVILCLPRAEDLLAAWDHTVSSRVITS